MSFGKCEKWGLWSRLGGAGAVLASALGASACKPAEEARAPRPPAIQLEEVTLRHYPMEGPPRVVRASDVTFNRESAEISAHAISARIPPTETLARGEIRLEAEEGRGDIHGNEAEAIGALKVETGAGDLGETVGSVWDSSTGLVQGDRPIRVRGPGYSVDGESYRFHVEDQQLSLERGVHVVSHAQAAGKTAEEPR